MWRELMGRIFSPPTSQPPVPTMALVAHLDGATAIARTWRSQADAMACARCPVCSAVRATCLIMIPVEIPNAEALEFSLGKDAPFLAEV